MHVYPFTAIVGQEEMKLALILCAIEPQIGGVLILGHRGTGKSTAVRALAELLPPIRRVKGCAFGCDPAEPAEWCEPCQKRAKTLRRLPVESGPVRVVELPLGATEDRVCGTLDIERALQAGRKVFEPGLLARAHRGFLYIDEVNLLEDHLVDLLLDVAASGRNVVEREGVSVTHPARFVLVGSGNPEEGELRPQLLDRFGLHVRTETIQDIAQRVEIIRRRDEFERDPAGFAKAMAAEQECLRQRLIRARELLPKVRADAELLLAVAELCLRLRADGHRGELTLIRAARALAAFEGRDRAMGEDVRRLAVMALRHRLRSDALGGVDAAVRIDRALDFVFGPQARAASAGWRANGGTDLAAAIEGAAPPRPSDDGAASQSRLETPEPDGEAWRGEGAEMSVDPEDFPEPPGALECSGEASGDRRARAGKTGRPLHPGRRGCYKGATADPRRGAPVALEPTLRAAASRRDSTLPLRIGADDLRFKRLRQRSGVLVIFAVDASGSMAANRIAQAKGALLRLLQRAYVHRDRVALVSFRGIQAETVLSPSRSVQRAMDAVARLAVGGGTPLAAGLAEALRIARATRGTGEPVLLVLFTDGRANVSLRGGAEALWTEVAELSAEIRSSGVESVVISTARGFAGGAAQRLAYELGAKYIPLEPAGGRAEELVAGFTERLRARSRLGWVES